LCDLCDFERKTNDEKLFNKNNFKTDFHLILFIHKQLNGFNLLKGIKRNKKKNNY